VAWRFPQNGPIRHVSPRPLGCRGPSLPVGGLGTGAEAVALANAVEYVLAGAVFTTDGARAHRVAAALRCGTVWINDYHPYIPGAEWGGMKRSGNGRELGMHAMELYTEVKNVFVDLG